MSRLFTFGCSFTKYKWPTWANIIAFDQELDLYNFGLEGLGNRGIAIRILEADTKYKFKDTDIICILWSSWDREDRFRGIRLDPQGSIFSNNEVYGKNWIQKFYDDSNKIMKNIYDIHATNKMYGNYISWQASGFEYYKNDTLFKTTPQTITPEAKQIIKQYGDLLPNLFYWTDAEITNSFDYLSDFHPDVQKHLDLVEKQIYPKLGFTLNQNKKDRLTQLYERIKNEFRYRTKNRQKESEIIQYIISNEFSDIDFYQKSIVNESIV